MIKTILFILIAIATFWLGFTILLYQLFGKEFSKHVMLALPVNVVFWGYIGWLGYKIGELL